MRWKHRHTSLLIVFSVWIVSYLDRMVMSTAIPYIAEEFALSPAAMGVVMSAFFAGYALCQIPGGILSDKFGARKVLTIAILWWSALTALTGAAASLAQMLWIRVFFGVGEGVAPASTWKALANWTPAKDRAFANAIMMSSNSLGPALAPLFVVGIMAAWGWREVFYVLFIPGLLMALWVWFFLPDNPKDKRGIPQEELDELTDTAPVSKGVSAASTMTFFEVIRVPAVWKSFCILLFSNMLVWGFMSWIPTYLVQARNFKMTEMGFAASAPFFAGTIAMIASGWLMDNKFKERPQVLFIICQSLAALFLFLMFTAESTSTMIIMNILTGTFAFATVGVVFGLPMMAVPKDIAGRAMGIVNTAGQLAGFLAPMIVGALVTVHADGTRDFSTAFGFLCCAAITACVLACFYRPMKQEAA